MVKDFIDTNEFTREQLVDMIELSLAIKRAIRSGYYPPLMQDMTLGMIFQQSSTRTRVSFETGMYQLGGHALFLSGKESQIGRGEPIEDTARVLSRYCDGIMIRTYGQDEVEELAKYASIPVINGLTDFAHPCQVLADLMTVRERMTRLEGLKLCFVGDGNNMANSLIVGGLKCGMDVSVACPEGYDPDAKVLDFAKTVTDAKFTLCRDPREAAEGADVVITDVWASMGQEEEREKRRLAFEGIYQVNAELMKAAHPGAMVQHCLPAHRGEEITAEVFEAHADEIFDEAENRLHAQKAVMYLLMGEQ